MKKIIILTLALITFVLPSNIYAMNEVNVYFFYSNDCNFCSQENAFLEALKQRYPNMRIYKYEVSGDANYSLMKQAKELYNIKDSGVPFTIIGDTTYLGFSQSKKSGMQKEVYRYSKEKYDNKFGTNILNIGYRTDLEGEPTEYKDNDDYQIEETGPMKTASPSKNNLSLSGKYKSSIILISIGVILGMIALVLSLLERRKRK